MLLLKTDKIYMVIKNKTGCESYAYWTVHHCDS